MWSLGGALNDVISGQCVLSMENRARRKGIGNTHAAPYVMYVKHACRSLCNVRLSARSLILCGLRAAPIRPCFGYSCTGSPQTFAEV